MTNFGPRAMDFSTLGDLGSTFFSAYDGAQKRARENEKRAALADLGRGFDTLSPEGMKQVAGKLVSLGDIKSGVELLSSAAKLEKQARDDAAFNGFMGQVGGGQPQQPAGQGGGVGSAANAISSIESGGRYDALGPETRSGDRAHGKYQVMGANIGPWTEKYVGRRMTPQEFIASPEAQEAVFRGEFGRLEAKHGSEGAARAWFAGEGGMNDMGRKDVLGTSVADYGRKFSQNYGGGQQSAGAAGGSVKVAQANAGLPPDDPMPGIPTPELFRYAASPNARVAAAAKMAYEGRQRWAMEQGKGTDVQRNYERARQQGYTGTILDYQKELRQQVTVNNDMKQETEESKAIGKAAGEAASDVFKAGARAGQTLQRLTRMADLLDRAQTGKLAPAQMTVAQWGKALGFSDDTMKGLGLNPESVGSAEALQGLINQAVTGMIGAGGFPANNFSDADRKFLERSFPELQKTPEGNRLVLETLRISAERDRDKATAYAKWRKENKGSSFYDFETQWDASNASGPDRLGKIAEQAQRIAPPQAAQGQGGIPRVNSPADAMKLPKGSRFVAPDGSIRVVP